MVKALTVGCAGTRLSSAERAAFASIDPWGLILFGRNVASVAQLASLTAEFRECVSRADAPVLIDQEGGRVQRLRAPLVPDYPSNQEIGAIHSRDRRSGLRAAYLLSRLHAFDLARCGIDIDCLPVLDVPAPGAHAVIGCRAYAPAPDAVAELGLQACHGLLDGGVLPVVKHMPGHGRADVDSHKSLPRVTASLAELSARDFVPFAALRDMPLGMTAHVVFDAIDPDAPATTSPKAISEIIRGTIGFDGLLMSDDVSMNALSGTPAERTRAIFAAGCDIALHCNGVLEETIEVAEEAPDLSGASMQRSDRALALRRSVSEADEHELRAEFGALTGADVRLQAA